MCFLSAERKYLLLDALQEDVVFPAPQGSCLAAHSPAGAPRRRLFCGRSAVASSTAGAGAAVEPRGRGSGVLASGTSEDPTALSSVTSHL